MRLPVTVEQNDNVSSQGDEVYAIALGESKHPVSFIADKQCEELAFPILFPKGKYGYSVNREINLSPVKYFNAKLYIAVVDLLPILNISSLLSSS